MEEEQTRIKEEKEREEQTRKTAEKEQLLKTAYKKTQIPKKTGKKFSKENKKAVVNHADEDSEEDSV